MKRRTVSAAMEVLHRGLALALLLTTMPVSASAADPAHIVTWGSAGTGAGQFTTPRDAAWGVTGVFVTDTDANRMQRFDPLGAFGTVWGSVGTSTGLFSIPRGVACDSVGNVYVAEMGNHRIQVFNSNGGFIRTWGGQGSSSGQFFQPYGVAIDPAGNVFVVDAGNNRVQKFTAAGTFLTSWGSFGSALGQFNTPRGIACDSVGNVYVTDMGNYRIQKFNNAGGFLTSWGSSGTGDGQFAAAYDVACDSYGGVWVADPHNNRVIRYTATGTWLDTFGGLGTAPGQFNYPCGLTCDPSGHIFVTEMSGSRVQKFAVVRNQPSMTCGASTPAPRLGDAVTLSGRLTAGGAAVSGASVKLQSSSDGTSWTDLATASTNASGDYSASATPSVKTHYRAVFAGDAANAGSTSSSVIVTPALLDASVAPSYSSTAPRAGDTVTVSGRLSGSGAGVAGVAVRLQSSPDGSTWTDAVTGTTNASGDFSVVVTPIGPTHYRVVTAATTTYTSATSASTLVTPVLRATSLTLVAPAILPRASATFTLTGRLTETGGPAVSGAAVRVQRSANGTTWTDAGNATTNASGDYTISTSITSPTHYRVLLPATTVLEAATSDSVLVVPSEPDDDLAGATTPPAWPHAGAMRDAYDPRDVLRIDVDGSGHPIDLVLSGPAGATFDLLVHSGDVSSLDVVAPLLRTSGSSWPKGIRLANTRAASLYIVISRVSGSGSYTLTRTSHDTAEAFFTTTSPRRVRYGSSVALRGSVIERPWLTSNPVQLKIVSGGKTHYVTTTSRDGVVTHTLKPTARTFVSVRNAAVGTNPAGSWSTPLDVRVTHALSAPTPSKTSVKRGERFTIRGAISPSHPVGTRIILEAVHSSGKVIPSTVRVKSRTATSCTWVASGTLGIAGTWRFRARLAGDSQHDAGVSVMSRGVVAR